MNPARTLGPAVATGRYTQIWIYMVATPMGAIAGTGAYIHCVRQAGAVGWSWSAVREKHCYLAGGWRLEVCERDSL